MKILAVDTTSNICSTAILEDEKLIEENTINNGLTHSENLMPLIKDLFNKCQLKISDIDLIAVCSGPGSFTGIRIGIASIKAIAEVYNIPIASVTSLEALAKSAEKKETIISMIDAKNNQVYCGVFDDKIDLMEEYIADDIYAVLNKIKKYENATFVGNGTVIHKNLIKSEIKNAKFSNIVEQNSYYVGLIGIKKYQKNQLENADSIIPIYLRKR